MTPTTVSPKYQVVIPKEVRDQVHIRSGQRVSMIAKNGVIYIIPNVPVHKLKGTLNGLPINDFRDKTDRV